MKPSQLLSNFQYLRRRQGWIVEGSQFGQFANLALSAAQYVARTRRSLAWPTILKVDISPLCNLHCTVCVHAWPDGNENLSQQRFAAGQMMTVEQFRRIIDEVRDNTSAVSLYYLGDPLVHPKLSEIARVAFDAGLKVHVSTNFSFHLNDDRVARLAESGITHFTACVDGLTQENYEKTRVGGRIDLVLSNIERLCAYRDRHGLKYPKVEVQYIKFQHNLHELDEARALLQEMGVDSTVDYWGSLHNYTDVDPGTYAVGAPKSRALIPHCFWPYFSMVIRWNGDVIPCCSFRMGQTHTAAGTQLAFGNVFETGVKDVWDSQVYRQTRGLSARPEGALDDGKLEEHFCNGCPVLFETGRATNTRRGDRHRYEDLYEVDSRKMPRRKP